MEEKRTSVEGEVVSMGERAEASGSGLADVLSKIGVGDAQLNAVRDAMKDMNVEESLEKAREYLNETFTKAREYARKNPGVVLGGLAAVVIGAGVLAASIRKKSE